LKKLINIFLLGICVMSLFSGCGGEQSEQATSDKVLRIAIQPSATWAPLWYMKDKGLLEEALQEKGITVQWTEFDAGMSMNESFAAGQQDIGVSGDVPTISPLAAGQKNQIIANGGGGDKIQAIVVGNDSGITDAKGLKGKKIGIAFGSSAHHMLDSVLQNNGMSLDDVTTVNITAGDAETSLLNKQVDAVAFWEPNVTFLLDKKVGRLLCDQTGCLNGGGPIFATEKYIKSNPDAVKIFLEQYAKAAKYLKQHPQEVAEVVANHYHCTPEQMVKIFDEYEYPVKISQKDIDGLQNTIDFMKKINIIKKDINLKDFINTSFVDQLKN
jgi:sulfonate transport system substrate-binding protein